MKKISSDHFGLKLVRGWYFLAAPREVPPDAPFRVREAVRRGRAASWILLVVIINVILPIPGAWNKPSILITLLGVLAIDIIAIIFNRFRRITVAAILTIFTIELGLLGTLLSIPGGIESTSLPLFDITAQAQIVAVAMLAPAWTFAIMGLNITIIWVILHSSKLTPDLAHQLAVNPNILVQAVEIQIIITVLAFILVLTANLAIRRLDRAEEIFVLEKLENERQKREIEQQNQINHGIEQILGTLYAFSKGNDQAQVPLSQENILFRIAYALNNLFARVRRLRQAESQFTQAQQEILRLRSELQRNRAAADKLERVDKAASRLIDTLQHRAPMPLGKSGTIIDNIVLALRAPSVVPEASLPGHSVPASPGLVTRTDFQQEERGIGQKEAR